MRTAISLRTALQVIAEFDQYGGASVGLVAWELSVDERLIAEAREQGRAKGLIAPADYDQREQLSRLTPAGWLAVQGERERACAVAGRDSVIRADAAGLADGRDN